MSEPASYLSMQIRTHWNDYIVLPHDEAMALQELLCRAELYTANSGHELDALTPFDIEKCPVNFMSKTKYQTIKMSQLLGTNVQVELDV